MPKKDMRTLLREARQAAWENAYQNVRTGLENVRLNLRWVMEQQDVKPREIAELIQRSEDGIRNILRDEEAAVPGLDTVLLMCHALEIPLCDLEAQPTRFRQAYRDRLREQEEAGGTRQKTRE